MQVLIYKDEYVVLLHGQNLSLIALEFEIFLLFINQISCEDIINNVYNQNIEMIARNIDTHIKIYARK